jgi:hypothetical protein
MTLGSECYSAVYHSALAGTVANGRGSALLPRSKELNATPNMIAYLPNFLYSSTSKVDPHKGMAGAGRPPSLLAVAILNAQIPYITLGTICKRAVSFYICTKWLLVHMKA